MQFWPRALGRQRVLATRQCPARSHRLRSVRSATRRPGAAGRCGAAQRRTRAVSACSTRAIRSARSRPRALPPAVPQGQLNLTACDGWGPRRVGRAWQGGAGQSCWAIACGRGPPPRARTSCSGCTCASSCGATHGTEARACWGRRATGATLQRPWSALLIATGPLRRPLPLGRHAAARSRSARARGRAVGIFAGGDKNEDHKPECRPRQKPMPERPCNLYPSPLVTLGLRVGDAPCGVGWIPPLAEGRPERRTTATRSVQSPPQGPLNGYQDPA